jgi:hypothetical protein
MFFCMGGMNMQTAVKYNSEVKTMPLGGKMVKLENLTPILSPKERERRKREIETRLYKVFSKYPKVQ